MSIIASFGDRTYGSFLGLSDKDNAVSRTENFVNVFNSVTTPPVLSYHCVLNYFLTMSAGFHLNLTFRLKPGVSGIKIVSNCLQTIHFPSWVAHSHFDYNMQLQQLLLPFVFNASTLPAVPQNSQQLQGASGTQRSLPSIPSPETSICCCWMLILWSRNITNALQKAWFRFMFAGKYRTLGDRCYMKCYIDYSWKSFRFPVVVANFFALKIK